MARKQTLWWQLIKYEMKQFCLHTTLHGYRFIALPKRILLERACWIIIVIISLISAISLLFVAWNNFQTNPTIVVIDSTHHPVWNYIFPRVTICSFNKLSKKKIFKLATDMKKSSSWDGSTEELAWELRLLSQLFILNNDTVSPEHYAKLSALFKSSGYEEHQVLQTLAPSCDELLLRCKWKGEEKRCASIFEPVPTSEGFCCAFNYYALKNHTFAGVLPNKIPSVPRRVSACGFVTALEAFINSNPDDYFSLPVTAIGHQVLIQNPYHFPDWTAQNILIERGNLYMIGISPSLTYSTDGIKSVSLAQRKCLFANERDLLNFAGYKYHNCLVECRMNLTKKFCGCIPFYYFNPDGNYPETPFCVLKDVPCLREYRHLLISSIPGYNFNLVDKNHEWGTETSQCDCPADCDYVDYIAEASSGIFTRKYSTNHQSLYGKIVIKDQSSLRVFFNDVVFTRNRREVVFSWHTLLAYYGGILGLFIGFSFISTVELVYYFIIRLFVDYRKLKNATKEKRPNQNNIEYNRYKNRDSKLFTVGR